MLDRSIFAAWVFLTRKYFEYAKQSLPSDRLVICGVIIVASLSVLSILAVLRFIGRKKCIPRPSESQLTLLTFLTPTFAPWPQNYVALMPHCTRARSKIIEIQISLLLANICAGDIELRDYSDLADILCHRFRVYGWSIHLSVNLSLRLSVLRWICLSRVPSVIHRNKIADGFLPHFNGDTIAPDPGHIYFSNISGSICLDFIPYHDLENALCTIKSSLEPGSLVSFEFTTIAPNISFLSDSFVFCSLPFMRRTYLENDGMPRRTSAPMLISLHRVTELLTSGASPFTIEKIQNIAPGQIAAFAALHEALATDKTLRSASIQRWGERGWKEHRIMIAWERALLTTGCLVKWHVVARK